MGALPAFSVCGRKADGHDHIVQLLHKLSIRGVNGPEKLLKVIKVRIHAAPRYVPLPLTSSRTYRTLSRSTCRRTPSSSVRTPPLARSLVPGRSSAPPALSYDAETVRLSKFLPTLPETHNIAVFIGAMARGKDDFADGLVDHKIGISAYPLSASVACGKVRVGSSVCAIEL